MNIKICAVGLAVVFLSGCGMFQPKIDILGDVHMTSEGVLWHSPEGFSKKIGEPCKNSGGFSDINEGTAIYVKNVKGELLGLDKLREGKWYRETGKEIIYCKFPLVVREVPKSDVYIITVGKRNDMVYKSNELTLHKTTGQEKEKEFWVLDLSL
jgi:hypothetical protein